MRTINLLGLRCTDLIIKLRKKTKNLKKGKKILILTDDEFSKNNIILFCRFMKHKLLRMSLCQEPYKYMVQIGKKNKNIS